MNEILLRFGIAWPQPAQPPIYVFCYLFWLENKYQFDCKINKNLSTRKESEQIYVQSPKGVFWQKQRSEPERAMRAAGPLQPALKTVVDSRCLGVSRMRQVKIMLMLWVVVLFINSGI